MHGSSPNSLPCFAFASLPFTAGLTTHAALPWQHMGANGWMSMKNKKENTNKNRKDPIPIGVGNFGPLGSHAALRGGV